MGTDGGFRPARQGTRIRNAGPHLVVRVMPKEGQWSAPIRVETQSGTVCGMTPNDAKALAAALLAAVRVSL